MDPFCSLCPSVSMSLSVVGCLLLLLLLPSSLLIRAWDQCVHLRIGIQSLRHWEEPKSTLLVTCLYGCLSDPQAFGCLVLVAVHISSFSQNPPASSSVSKYNQRHGLSSKFSTKTTSEKQGERKRERENKRPSLHGVREFPMPKTWTGGRKRKMRGSAAHKGKGFRHRQGQKTEGRETPGARSPIGKATEQNGELPLFCYCFWSLFVGPRRRILKVVAEKQLFKKNSFLPRNLKMLCFLIWKRKSILRRITKCHNVCHAFWHW
jgi:hypothetical protein